MSTISKLRTQLVARREVKDTALTTSGQGYELERVVASTINWNDIIRVLEDLLVSIQHEGQYRSAKVRETISFVQLAMDALSDSASETETRLNRSNVHWSDHWLAFIPTEAGRRAKNVLSIYKGDVLKLKSLQHVIYEAKELRFEIAEALNEAIGEHLLATNAEYAKLHKHADLLRSIVAEIENATILLSVNKTQERELVRELYERLECRPPLPKRLSHSNELIDPTAVATAGFNRHLSETESAITRDNILMKQMREAMKADIYRTDQ